MIKGGLFMAKISECTLCGLKLDGEKNFCPQCGGPMQATEVAEPDAFSGNVPPQLQNARNAGSEPAAPFDNAGSGIPPVPPMNDVPPVNNNIPPVNNNIPPVNNNIPPINNNIPPYGNNMNLNNSMMQPTPQKNSKDGLAIAGMVVGIVSVPCICFGWVAIIIGIVGLILSILGLKSPNKKGMAIAGLICSIVGLIGGLIVLIVAMLAVNEAANYAYRYNFDWDWD
jgi:hypothetical protein